MSEDILIHSPIEVAIMEMHNLAYFYHWGYRECWDIPCTERKVFNDRIRKQIKAETNGGSNGTSPKSSYRENRQR